MKNKFLMFTILVLLFSSVGNVYAQEEEYVFNNPAFKPVSLFERIFETQFTVVAGVSDVLNPGDDFIISTSEVANKQCSSASLLLRIKNPLGVVRYAVMLQQTSVNVGTTSSKSISWTIPGDAEVGTWKLESELRCASDPNYPLISSGSVGSFEVQKEITCTEGWIGYKFCDDATHDILRRYQTCNPDTLGVRTYETCPSNICRVDTCIEEEVITDSDKVRSCASEGGIFCSTSSTCDGIRVEEFDSSEGICCRGNCIGEEDTTTTTDGKVNPLDATKLSTYTKTQIDNAGCSTTDDCSSGECISRDGIKTSGVQGFILPVIPDFITGWIFQEIGQEVFDGDESSFLDIISSDEGICLINFENVIKTSDDARKSRTLDELKKLTQTELEDSLCFKDSECEDREGFTVDCEPIENHEKNIDVDTTLETISTGIIDFLGFGRGNPDGICIATPEKDKKDEEGICWKCEIYEGTGILVWHFLVALGVLVLIFIAKGKK